ncbi:helix-turn-helix domain-containing protein [Kitasatospora sp. NPDC002227]|uniref:winged helix-turn-helix transcriptional regulator n=1 Tax=Kitasatospora sp. NPDC002227 TaxID=3154773 RepID=UPI00332F350B
MDADCALAQALGVVGGRWTLLIVGQVADGVHRFDELHGALGLGRKVLAQRLHALVEHGVLEKRLYHPHPPRFEYHLSEKGGGLLPVLEALRNWAAGYAGGG